MWSTIIGNIRLTKVVAKVSSGATANAQLQGPDVPLELLQPFSSISNQWENLSRTGLVQHHRHLVLCPHLQHLMRSFLVPATCSNPLSSSEDHGTWRHEPKGE
jgi:hypothetical protein